MSIPDPNVTDQPPQGGAIPPVGPPPASSGTDVRTWAMLCHLAGLGNLVLPLIGNIIGPLVVWLIKKDQDPLIDREGKKALNFQITMAIVQLIGFCLLPAIMVVQLIFTIIAAVKTSNGEDYKYPFSITFIK